jgi:predicted nucleotidyltransferase
MTQFEVLLAALREQRVSFVIIGGIAATLHGSARLTNDLDVAYERSAENIQRLGAALSSFEPYLRGAPPGLPFRFDAATIRRGLNFTLRTTAGDVDVLGEVTGVGTYEDVERESVEMEFFGSTYKVINLNTLIRAKRAAGRAKDLEVIAELEALQEERQQP